MTPVIGITPDGHEPKGQPTEGRYQLRMNYAGAVRAAGGFPVIIPWLANDAEIIAERCDGLLITGGTPGVSSKSGRTEFEMAVIRAAMNAARPLLGVCNGMQLMGRALGAQFVNAIAEQIPGAVDHIPGITANRSCTSDNPGIGHAIAQIGWRQSRTRQQFASSGNHGNRGICCCCICPGWSGRGN